MTAALVFGYLRPWLATILASTASVRYVALLELRPTSLRRFAFPGRVLEFLNTSVVPARSPEADDEVLVPGTGTRMRWILPALAAIVLASVGMVHSAIVLASRWGVESNVVGMIVLAGRTGIPNVIAAVRLALHQRGAAVASEALNSNTLNLLVTAEPEHREHIQATAHERFPRASEGRPGPPEHHGASEYEFNPADCARVEHAMERPTGRRSDMPIRNTTLQARRGRSADASGKRVRQRRPDGALRRWGYECEPPASRSNVPCAARVPVAVGGPFRIHSNATPIIAPTSGPTR